jgi:hypothetical protein
MISKLLPLAVCGVFMGCAPAATPRYELSGTVTYNGQPVPAGTILFKPDNSQNNRGPGAQVSIDSGRYHLTESRSTIGGPHVVIITGFDGIPTTNGPLENKLGKPLFPPYEVKVDLPREKSTQDFTVPKPAAR